MIRIMLAGIGGYGKNYLAELLENKSSDIELSGICDPYADKSPLYRQVLERNIPVFDSLAHYFTFQNSCGIKTNLTVISSPIHTHYDFIRCALQHNSNVLCEKPPCATVEEMDDLLELEKKSPCFVAVGYQQCFSRDVLELKQDIVSGIYGKPLLMKSLRMMRRGMNYYRRNNWVGKKTVNGSPVFDSPFSNACAHEFQTMLFLLGTKMDSCAEIKKLDAVLYKANPEIENFDAVALQCNAGIPVLYYTAHCTESEKTGPISMYKFEKGIVLYNGNFCAYAPDNSILKDYGNMDKGLRMQKLYDCIHAAEYKTRPICCLQTTASHVKAIRLIQDIPVTSVTDGVFWSDETDSYYSIKKIEETFLQHYEMETLPKRERVF